VSSTAKDALGERVYAFLVAQPGMRFGANKVASELGVRTKAVQACLSSLCAKGKIGFVSVPPRGKAYFVRTEANDQNVRPRWQELKGWESGLRGHMALCELGHNR